MPGQEGDTRPGILLLVAAEAREFRGILRNCQQVKRLGWPVQFAIQARWAGRTVWMVAHGPGPRLAAAAFDAAWARQEEGKDRVTAIGSVGFCGGLDPGLGVGDIVIATRVLAPEHGRNYDCQPVRTSLQAAHGAVLSVDRVAVTTDEKAELRQSGAVAVEMEAAAVAQAAGQHRVPFFALRVVSDTARDGFVINMNEMRNAAGRFDRARILRAALARPLRRIAALGRLNRHCRIAEERLGEFFASCRFE